MSTAQTVLVTLGSVATLLTAIGSIYLLRPNAAKITVDTAQGAVKSAADSVALSDKQRDDLVVKVDQLVKRVESLEAERGELNRKLTEALALNANLKSAKNRVESRNAVLEDQNTQLRTENSNLEKRVASLEREVRELKAAATHYDEQPDL